MVAPSRRIIPDEATASIHILVATFSLNVKTHLLIAIIAMDMIERKCQVSSKLELVVAVL